MEWVRPPGAGRRDGEQPAGRLNQGRSGRPSASFWVGLWLRNRARSVTAGRGEMADSADECHREEESESERERKNNKELDRSELDRGGKEVKAVQSSDCLGSVSVCCL